MDIRTLQAVHTVIRRHAAGTMIAIQSGPRSATNQRFRMAPDAASRNLPALQRLDAGRAVTSWIIACLEGTNRAPGLPSSRNGGDFHWTRDTSAGG